MTAHLATTTRHGTSVGYNHDGCRCDACRRAHRRYQEQRRLDLLHGKRRLVPALGTARRLQGLAVLGWGLEDVARLVGNSPEVLARLRDGRRQRVTPATEAAVRAVTRELLGRGPGPSPRSRTWARKNGWVSLFAWDDIDDPDARPNVTGAESAPRADEGAVLRLTRAGRSATEIAVALGVSRRTVVRVRARVKETAA